MHEPDKQEWFYRTMKPALVERNISHLDCSYRPTIIAKATSLTVVNSVAQSPNNLITSLFPSNHLDKPQFPPQQTTLT